MHRKQAYIHAQLARAQNSNNPVSDVKEASLVHLLSLRFFLSRLSPSAPLRFEEPPDRLLPVAIRSKIRLASQSGNAFWFV